MELQARGGVVLTFAFLVCESEELSREQFNAWQQDWVQFSGQEYVIVLV